MNCLQPRRTPQIFVVLALVLCTSFFLTSATAQNSADGGTISGRISNVATGDYLQGAVIAVKDGGTTLAETLTDIRGAYAVGPLAPGSYQMTVTYTGLDRSVTTIALGAGQRENRDIGLTSTVYALAPIVVSGEREGNARAITLQRISANLKNIVATDAFGSVKDGNVGDYVKLLPGVYGNMNSNQTETLRIRGIDPALNTITVDGFKTAAAPPNGDATRVFEIQFNPIDAFSTVELTKSPAPAQPADSIGGSLNLITKSAFDSKYTGRKITISVGGEGRTLKRNEPSYNWRASFQDQYAVFGSKERNLGVSVTASLGGTSNQAQNESQMVWVEAAGPDVLADVKLQATTTYDPINGGSNPNSRIGTTLNLDYKLSDTTTFKFRSILDWYTSYVESNFVEWTPVANVVAFNPDGSMRTRNQAGPFGPPQTVVPAGTNGNQAGTLSDNTSTLTRSPNATFLDVFQRFGKSRHSANVGFIGEHKLPSVSIDYGVQYGASDSRRWQNPPDGGQYRWQVPFVGVEFAATDNPALKRVTQTSGPDWTNPANWSMPNSPVRYQDFSSTQTSLNAYANVTKALTVANLPIKLESGLRFTESQFKQARREDRYTNLGADGVQNTADDHLTAFVDTARAPYGYFEGTYYAPIYLDPIRMRDNIASNPAQWRYDAAFNDLTMLQNDNAFREQVTAAYVQGTFKIKRLDVLAGVRFERTGVLTRTHPSVAGVLQPFREKRTSSYEDYFPGLHLKYNFTKNLLWRLSYSTSVGRPPPATLISRQDINDVTRIITEATPFLRPQTSENYDTSLEYYFEPVGLVSVSYFRKNITDYIQSTTVTLTADNPYGAQYANYSLRSQTNFGEAFVEGYELSYQQQLTFLPGLLQGTSVFANYTHLTTEGQSGTAVTSALTNFVPTVFNVGLSWRYKGFSSQIRYSWADEFMNSFNTNPYARDYNAKMGNWDVNLTYAIRKNIEIYLNGFHLGDTTSNLTYHGEGMRNRVSDLRMNGIRIGAGVTWRL